MRAITLRTLCFAVVVFAPSLVACDRGGPVEAEPLLPAGGIGPSAYGYAAVASPATILNGAGGGLSFQNGEIMGYLYVSRSDATREAWLFYSLSRCSERFNEQYQWWEWTCEDIAAGDGLIPASDLNGGGRNTLVLDTNTADNPQFFHWAGSGGHIRITWTASPGWRFSRAGTQTYGWGNWQVRSSGSALVQAAGPAGTILGESIGDSAFGEIAENRGVSVILSRGR